MNKKELKEALETVMQTFDQTPCENAVSREAVIEWLKDKDIIKLKSQEERARQELNELPSVTLRQTECNDAISREAALKECYDIVIDGERYRVIQEETLLGLPPVTVQQTEEWIPVSKRLPKIAGVYRVTRYYPNNIMNPNYLVDACFFDGSNIWYNDNRINHERVYVDNIIAWQENPEPYTFDPQKSENEK